MLNLRDILNTQSSILEDKRVKLVRHKDARTESKEFSGRMKDREFLTEYQKRQGKNVFNCDYIVSFYVFKKRTVLLGVFKVDSVKQVNGDDYYFSYNYFYELSPVNLFEDLEDRVVIDWGKGYLSWCQDFKNEKRVLEILPRGYIGDFPGLDRILLDFQDLKQLIHNPEANQQWLHHLSAVNGIYLITDIRTGHLYIGSAYGKNGLWQRWSNYAFTGHGGNKVLQDLIKEDPNYSNNFRFSILQTLPSNISTNEVIQLENLYKEKFLTRAFGLNSN